ncbi:hypothetical protein [Floridanema aerugineum]|uniref:Uncharacterized protein n=1 Tax=Floridaenema aerugineum BLCC-F46 TaxID=3153654 RepID=A0ABV4XH38_9CYAN
MCIVLILAAIAAFLISIISGVSVFLGADNDNNWALLIMGFIGGLILVWAYKGILSC